MVAKLDAEKIESLALVPACAAPNRRDGVDHGIRAWETAFQPQPFVALGRMEMIDHFEARLLRVPVDPRHRAQPHEILHLFQIFADADDMLRSDFERQFAPIDPAAKHGFRSGVQQRRYHRKGFSLVGDHRLPLSSGRSEYDQSSAPFFQMKKKPQRIKTMKISISTKANIFNWRYTTAHG